MTRTVISSATREVVIGDDRPFVIIGERINPTGRPLLAAEMKAGDFSRVERDVLAQVEAGAHMLDVNAGIPLADEPAILATTVQLVQSLTDLPLSIDSSIVEALEAGLAVYQGKALVNSVTGEEERLERVLPLVRKYGAAVVAISNDETGISEDPDVRFAVAKQIVERAADHGIPREDVIVDPLLMPIGAMPTAGRQVFRILGRLRDELGVNSTCGASNVSFGLPNREGINGAFLTMAIASGLTSAITNPIAEGVRHAVMAADVLMGNDRDAGRWIRQFRVAPPDGENGGRRVNRRRGARRGGRFGDHGMTRSAEPLVIFTPSGRRGHVRDRHHGPRRGPFAGGRHRFGVRRARHLRALPGVESASGRSRSTGSRRPRKASRRSGRWRPATAREGPRSGPPPRCTATVRGDCLIDVPQESQVHRQVVRKGLDVRDFEIDPVVRLHYVEVERPELASPSGDLIRLFEALEREWGLTGLESDLHVVRALQPALDRRRLRGDGGRPRRAGR